MVVSPKEHRKEVDDVGCVLERKPKKTSPQKFHSNFAPQKMGKAILKRKGNSSSNHLFSGAKIVEFRGCHSTLA